MLFKDVVGQQALKDRLIKNINSGRISHAQLFVGNEGSGNLALAVAYAQYILCTNKEENDACNTCPSCKKVRNLSHPDLHFSYPVVTKPKLDKPVSTNFINEWRSLAKEHFYFNLDDWLECLEAENKQGRIFAKEGEEIIKKMNFKAYESDFKIMIIWAAELMNQECSNKLLKIIEEPPSNTIFLLVTEWEEQILTTIRSRCQLIYVPSIQKEDIAQKLRTFDETDNTKLEQIAHLSHGNYRKALIALNPDQKDSFHHEKFKDLMRYCYSLKFQDIFHWVDTMKGVGREKQKQFLHYGLAQIRENFMHNLQKPELNYMDEEELNFSSRFSPFINERNIIPMSNEFEQAYKDISSNGNASIILLDMSLRIVKLLRR